MCSSPVIGGVRARALSFARDFAPVTSSNGSVLQASAVYRETLIVDDGATSHWNRAGNEAPPHRPRRALSRVRPSLPSSFTAASRANARALSRPARAG